MKRAIHVHIDDLPDYFSLHDLSGVIPVSKATLYRYAEQGGIPCIRVGRRVVLSKIAVKKWLGEDMEVECNG